MATSHRHGDAPLFVLALTFSVLAGACAEQQSALPFGADAASCATCHEAQYESWRGSAHASSGTSPVFVALLEQTRTSWGETAASACVDCHQPDHAGNAGHEGEAAITCISCHAATGSIGERDGRLLVDPGYPLMGPSGEGGNGAHEIRASAFLSSASLCGTCHEVSAPGLLEEPTLSEYRQSRFADAGISCADCHMPDGEHRFVGVDPAWDGDETAQADAMQDARVLMADALTLTLEQDPGAETILVTLENTGAGHAVPTGAAFLRDAWVEVRFDDTAAAAGSRVLSLGAELTQDGLPVSLITDADEVRPRGIAPGERRSERVDIPPEATRVSATLNFRAIRWDTLEALGLEARIRDVPTLEIRTLSIELD